MVRRRSWLGARSRDSPQNAEGLVAVLCVLYELKR